MTQDTNNTQENIFDPTPENILSMLTGEACEDEEVRFSGEYIPTGPVALPKNENTPSLEGNYPVFLWKIFDGYSRSIRSHILVPISKDMEQECGVQLACQQIPLSIIHKEPSILHMSLRDEARPFLFDFDPENFDPEEGGVKAQHVYGVGPTRLDYIQGDPADIDGFSYLETCASFRFTDLTNSPAEIREEEPLFSAGIGIACLALEEGVTRNAQWTNPCIHWGTPHGMFLWLRALIKWLNTPDAHTMLFSIAKQRIERIEPDMSMNEQDRAARETALAMTDTLGRWHRQLMSMSIDDALEETNGIRRIDTSFHHILASIGEAGKTCANSFAQSQRNALQKHGEDWQSWDVWFEAPEKETSLGWRLPFALSLLASSLWRDRIKLGFSRIARLNRETSNTLNNILRPQSRVVVRDQGALITQGDTILATQSETVDLYHDAPNTSGDLIQKMLQANLDNLKTIQGIRLLVFLIRESHKQYALNPEGRYHDIIIEGGISALRERLGISSKKADVKIKAALDAGAVWQPIDTKGRGLWTWEQTRAAPGKPAILKVRLGFALCPDSAYIGSTRLMTPICEIGPIVGRRNEHAKVVLLQQVLTHEIAFYSRQIPQRGGVYISQDRREEIAQSLELPTNTMESALERWKRDEEDGLAVFEEVELDTFHLANNETYGRERDFLTKQGDLRERNAQRGRKSAQNKSRTTKK
jgi:hypothetical protein